MSEQKKANLSLNLIKIPMDLEILLIKKFKIR